MKAFQKKMCVDTDCLYNRALYCISPKYGECQANKRALVKKSRTGRRNKKAKNSFWKKILYRKWKITSVNLVIFTFGLLSLGIVTAWLNFEAALVVLMAFLIIIILRVLPAVEK